MKAITGVEHLQTYINMKMEKKLNIQLRKQEFQKDIQVK